MRRTVIFEGLQETGQYIRPGSLYCAYRVPIYLTFNHQDPIGWGTEVFRDTETNGISFKIDLFRPDFSHFIDEQTGELSDLFEISLSIGNIKYEVVQAIDWINDEPRKEIVGGEIQTLAVIASLNFHNRLGELFEKT